MVPKPPTYPTHIAPVAKPVDAPASRADAGRPASRFESRQGYHILGDLVSDFPLTDMGNAQRLVSIIGDRFLYVPNADGWRYYADGIWQTDAKAARVRGEMMKVSDELLRWARTKDDPALLNRVMKTQSIAAINGSVVLASSLLCADSATFDMDPNALNCKNGTLFLHNHILYAHNPHDKLTLQANANYDPDAEAPNWERYLHSAVPDEETRRFLQRAVGYSLTPTTGEQCFFLLWGPTGTGKSRFVEAVRHMLGTYAASCASTSLTTRKEGVRSDIATLQAKRFITSQELRRTDTLDVSLLKAMTGDETIRVARKHQDEFDLTFTGKLWITTNPQPQVPAGEVGIWRRAKIVKFSSVYADDEVDTKLPSKLDDEADGILAWAVEGHRLWIEQGLKPPSTVSAEVLDYRTDTDSVGMFVTERLVVTGKTGKDGDKVDIEDLYHAYLHHCKNSLHCKPLAINPFSSALNTYKGIRPYRTMWHTYKTGVKLASVFSFDPASHMEPRMSDTCYME